MKQKFIGENNFIAQKQITFLVLGHIFDKMNRKMHARAREISLKVNNRLILSKVKGVPCEVDIFKQVLKRGGFGISLLSSGRSDLEGPAWS